MTEASHRDLILDQFTRQATPFSTSKTIASEEALRLLVDACGAGPNDTVLDVACGGGLVVCAFAQVVRRAEGIDITPAMLDRARTLAAEKGLTNVAFRQGEAMPLPYPDASFSIVACASPSTTSRIHSASCARCGGCARPAAASPSSTPTRRRIR